MALTSAQEELITTLDDVAEHVSWEFEDDYEGISTLGFAEITSIRGTGSFVRRVQSLAKEDEVDWVRERDRSAYVIEIGSLELSLRKHHRSGYTLSVTNVSDFVSGPEHQRIDARLELNELVLQRLQYNGFLSEARVTSRAD